MKLNINTLVFQEMIVKAVKGASCNKMIPITGLMAISLKDNILTVTTTDATNTLKIIHKGVEGEDFYVVVPVDLFSKLVAKTTSDSITLELVDTTLTVKGNGVYSIELPLNEDGNLITFPQYVFNENVEKSKINLSAINTMLLTNKAALADTMEVPCLTGYYCGEDKVISTDSFKVCGNNIKVFSKPVLLSAELIDLLAIVGEEQINVQQDGSKILFSTENIVIYGSELEGIEDYPVEAIENYLSTAFESMCKIPKTSLLNILDRLSLFISSYDKNALYLTFNEQELVISSKRSNGTESIKYQTVENYKPYVCCIDIELLRSQVAAQDSEVVELWFGNETAIKMVSGKITQIVSLLEDDRDEE